jgi:pilus assembly protein FimV
LDDLESLEQEPGLGQEGEPGRQSAEAENIDSVDALALPDNSELPLPEEVMVGDEVDTKLDLAQAYVEMGDAEGARSILDEVLAEGSRGQKQEAQKMLGQLA